MMLVILSMLLATCLAAPASQSLTFHDDGSYRFHYETGEEGGSHSRSEIRNPDGVVIGKFSYQDPEGEIREVNYRADVSGFVAQGDVGVPGAPKGQFPVPENRQQEQTPQAAPAAETTEEPQAGDQQQQPQAVHDVEPYRDEEADKDDMQDLGFDESAALDDPPEGFPPGFFLQKFQGLRRLTEPTKMEKPVTTESPKKDKPAPQPEPSTEAVGDDKREPEVTNPTEVYSRDPSIFTPLKPFHGLSPQEWASTMFHQPVYVYSYHQPDSYGYRYFF